LCVHPDGHDHRRRGHPAILAGLDVSGVDPDVGIRTLQRPTPEALDLLIELLAQFGDIRLLEMPSIPNAFTSSSTLRVETPCTYASWTTVAKAFSAFLLGPRSEGQ
jgi:hypothetical protein